MNPTIVLVHGVFAESASWDGVIEPLRGSGHRVIAAANALRDLASRRREYRRPRSQQRTVESSGAAHALSVSQPQATADLILEAVALPAAA